MHNRAAQSSSTARSLTESSEWVGIPEALWLSGESSPSDAERCLLSLEPPTLTGGGPPLPSCGYASASTEAASQTRYSNEAAAYTCQLHDAVRQSAALLRVAGPFAKLQYNWQPVHRLCTACNRKESRAFRQSMFTILAAAFTQARFLSLPTALLKFI